MPRITDVLADRFHGVFNRETVARVVGESYDLLAENAITIYLPTLAARFARQRLTDQAAPTD